MSYLKTIDFDAVWSIFIGMAFAIYIGMRANNTNQTEENKMERKTEWTNSKGTKICVITSVKHTLDNQGRRKSGWTRCIEQDITIDGKNTMGWVQMLDAPVVVGDVTAVARIDNYAITEIVMVQLNKDRLACEQSAEYQDHLNREAQADKLDTDYRNHVNNINNMMTCNGTSY